MYTEITDNVDKENKKKLYVLEREMVCRNEEETKQTAHMTLFTAGLQVTLPDRIMNERNKNSITMVEVVKKYKIN